MRGRTISHQNAMNSANAPDLLDQAIAHHEAGRIALAEAAYRAVLTHDPNDLDALNLLGLLRQQQGDLTEAMALLTRALTADPDFPEALTNMARLKRALRDPSGAADAARRALALDPDLPEAQLQLGGALLELHDPAAEAALMAAVAAQPNSADALGQLGLCQLLARRYAEAATTLRDASAHAPGDAAILINLGMALLGTDRLDDAVAVHERAAAIAPDDPAAFAALALTQRRRLATDASIAAGRRAVALAPDRTDMWLLLGANLAAKGDFNAAEACYRQVLAQQPDNPEAARDLAMIGRLTADQVDVSHLQALVADATAPDTDRAAAGFALARLLDQSQHHDGAFAALTAANQAARRSLAAAGKSYDPAAFRRYVDWVHRTFTKTLFTQTSGWGDASDRPVFIVGMARSGTSLVEQIVASHARVFGAGERRDIGQIIETLPASDGYPAPQDWTAEQVRAAAGTYLARLSAIAGGADRITDKLPDNLTLLGHIAVLFPHARVILCRRDPRDTCLSCYFTSFGDGMEWTFDQASLAAHAQETERLVHHWRSVLPLPIHEIVYEDLVGDLEGESRRLIAFLDLPWDPACLRFHETERPVLTASYWQVRQTLYAGAVGRWRPYRRHLGPLLAGLAGLVQIDDAEDEAAIVAVKETALEIAGANHRLGRFNAAEPVYRALLRHDPDNPRILHLLGLLLVDRNQPAQAISLIQRSLELRPDVAVAYCDLARAFRKSQDLDAALDAGRRAMALDPGLSDAFLQTGLSLADRESFDEAMAHLQRAIELAPKSIPALKGLGACHMRRRDYAQAAAVWEAALSLDPDDAEMLEAYAGSLTELRRYDEADHLFRYLIERGSEQAEVHQGLAAMLFRQGDGDASIEVCRTALEKFPDNITLLLQIGAAEGLMGRFDKAEAAYRHVLTLQPDSSEALNGLASAGQALDAESHQQASKTLHDDTRPWADRCAAGFSIGKERDRAGDYDTAFAAYRTANEILREAFDRRGKSFSRSWMAGYVNAQMAAFQPQLIAQAQDIGCDSEEPVFIVGQPRSGTTLVEQICASHPAVFGMGEKHFIHEIAYALNGPDAPRPPAAWDRQLVQSEVNRHLSAMRAMKPGAARYTDKMPDNILLVGVIALLYPKARIIYSRRDPRDIALSCYFQYFTQDGMAWTTDLGDCGYRIHLTNRLMAHWKQSFPGRIFDIQYETLVANLESESRRLIGHLGLEWDPACLDFHKAERPIHTASVWQVRQPLYDTSVGRWRHYESYLAPLLAELDDADMPSV